MASRPVSSIWQKLTRGTRRAPLVCYLRENGPIAYELPLFTDDARAAVEAMLATGLAWYWRGAGAATGTGEWTQLTRWSLGAFLPDLDRGLLAVGVDSADAPAGGTDEIVAGWLRPFCAERPGPAHAFIARALEGDRVFVAQQPAEPVRELLQAWGIDRGRAERRAYARLRGESLEEITRSLADGGP
jgi:hypothetical protein